MAWIVNLGRLSVGRCGGEVDVEIVLYLVPQPKQEADEDDDFEDDEFDLSQPVAELGDAVWMALRHKSPFRPKEIREIHEIAYFLPRPGGVSNRILPRRIVNESALSKKGEPIRCWFVLSVQYTMFTLGAAKISSSRPKDRPDVLLLGSILHIFRDWIQFRPFGRESL